MYPANTMRNRFSWTASSENDYVACILTCHSNWLAWRFIDSIEPKKRHASLHNTNSVFEMGILLPNDHHQDSSRFTHLFLSLIDRQIPSLHAPRAYFALHSGHWDFLWVLVAWIETFGSFGLSVAGLDFHDGTIVSIASSAMALLIKNSITSLNLGISFVQKDSQHSMVFLSNALRKWTSM